MNTDAALAEAVRLGGDVHLTWKCPKEIQRRLMSAEQYQKDLAELEALRKFKAAAEPVLHRFYDVMYFDSDKNCFDPQKEIDSACDFLDMVHIELLTLYPSPQLGATEYPPIKENA